uniref:Ribonuclease H n=1 Tax=viral metagenome TaxID=1070528 RepID=A0A6C0KRG7_9ZZZZ
MSKWYAVAKGFIPGLYDTWDDASQSISGYPSALYKGFNTKEEAQLYLNENMVEPRSRLDTLTDEQHRVIDYLLTGQNLFLTGGGGVGKSYLLSVIYTEFPGLKLKQNQVEEVRSVAPRIQMCALTGCAALLLGHKAKTLHSWAGIGLGKGTVAELYIKISRNTKSKRNWLLTDLLIIDEISMMTAELLDKLNELGKKIRKSQKPFGGIQVLLVGDFYQLPPVNKGDDPIQFAFESEVWKDIPCCIELTQIQRQKDERFQRILKEARTGSLSKESCEVLRSLEGRDWKSNPIRPTLLYPKRAEVQLINETNLKALKGRREMYKARLVYDGKQPQAFRESDPSFQQSLAKFDSDAAYAVDLELVLNAQVMLIANVDADAGLVNGTRGYITGFCAATDRPIVEFINGTRRPIGFHSWPIEEYEFCARSQIPLRLAWACTTHKAQGASLDSALVDIGAGNFEFGQAYVALSRVRSLEALYVHDFEPTVFKAHPKVKAFYESLERMPKPQAPPTSAPIKEEVEVVVPGDPIKQKEEAALPALQEPGNNWLFDSVPAGWKETMKPCEEQLLTLSQTLNTKTFLPAKDQIWTALTLTPLQSIKVVILGQDPYPTPGNAHGLAFSTLEDGRVLPASLKNIYKELLADLGVPIAPHGNLTKWACQGILLLNTVLTVEAGAPQSHAKLGWEEVTDQIIRAIAAQTKKTIFVLWGKSAQVKKKLLSMYLDLNQHRVLESAHPSPLSASKGFMGSKPFSTINRWITELDKEPIQWSLS